MMKPFPLIFSISLIEILGFAKVVLAEKSPVALYLMNDKAFALQATDDYISYSQPMKQIDPSAIIRFHSSQKLFMSFNESFGIYLTFQDSMAIRKDVGIHVVSPVDGSITQMNTDCFYEGRANNNNEGSSKSFFVLNSCQGSLRGSIVLRRQDDNLDYRLFKLDADNVNGFTIEEQQPHSPTTNLKPQHCMLKRSSSDEPTVSQVLHDLGAGEMKFGKRGDLSTTKRKVEIFLVNDYYRYELYGARTETDAIQLVQFVNLLFAKQTSFPELKLVFMMTEAKPKFLTSTSTDVDVSAILEQTCSWRSSLGSAGNYFGLTDVQMYLSGRNLIVESMGPEYSIEGVAYLNGACTIKQACSVVHTNPASPTIVQAVYFAHEVGHLLGSDHDGEDGNQCDKSGYIMQAVGCGGCELPATDWSKCSVKYINDFMETQNSKCIQETLVFQPALCGNGVLDEGEECDSSAGLYSTSGTANQNQPKFQGPIATACCSATCKLTAGSQCDENTLGQSSCCSNCSFKATGSTCRAAKTDQVFGPCDIADKCSGTSPYCPDTVQPDYTPCLTSTNENGICLFAQCRTRSAMCQSLGGFYSQSTCDASQSCSLVCSTGSACVNALEGTLRTPIKVPDSLPCTLKNKKGSCREGSCIVSHGTQSKSPNLLFTLITTVLFLSWPILI